MIAKMFLKKKKLILMDLDGTIFPWEWGADYTVPGYFENLQIIHSMKLLVDILRNDKRYVFKFCTAYTSEQAKKEKIVSLIRNFPGLSLDEIIFVPYGESKYDYVKNLLDKKYSVCLIDDYSHNLFDFKSKGGNAIKAMNGVNGTKGTWTGASIDVYANPSKNLRYIENYF